MIIMDDDSMIECHQRGRRRRRRQQQEQQSFLVPNTFMEMYKYSTSIHGQCYRKLHHILILLFFLTEGIRSQQYTPIETTNSQQPSVSSSQYPSDINILTNNNPNINDINSDLILPEP